MILKGYTDEQINKIMAHYGRTRKTKFWEKEYEITPEIIVNTQGDGLQTVFLTPIDTRPNYYVLRIDSKIDIENDCVVNEGTEYEIDICEMLLQMIEEEHVNINNYEKIYNENGETFYQYEDEDPKTYDEVYFPTLHWSGGSWGAMCDVSYIFNKP